MAKFERADDPFNDGDGYRLLDEHGVEVAYVVIDAGRHRPFWPDSGRPVSCGLVHDAVRALERTVADVVDPTSSVGTNR
jgi:hypothetical protein